MASSSKQLGVGGWEDQTSWAPEVLQVEPGDPLPEVQQTVDDHQFHYLQSPQSQWSPTVSSTYGCADNGHPLPAPGQGVHAHGQGQGRLTQGSTPSTGPQPSLPGPIAPCRTPLAPRPAPAHPPRALRQASCGFWERREAEWCKLGRRWGHGG